MQPIDTTLIDEAQALLAPIPKPTGKQALFYAVIDLADLEFVEQGDDAPVATFMGIPVQPVNDADDLAVGDYYNAKKREIE